MAYVLPKFRDTFLVTAPGETNLYERRRSGEHVHVARMYGDHTHMEIWSWQRMAVLRHRRLQRLWAFGGKYFAFTRRLILIALWPDESKDYLGILARKPK
jgi:hypothetical protein